MSGPIVARAKVIPECLFGVLVFMYDHYPQAVAAMCDEELDPSGELLGRVREEARNEPTS